MKYPSDNARNPKRDDKKFESFLQIINYDAKVEVLIRFILGMGGCFKKEMPGYIRGLGCVMGGGGLWYGKVHA